MLVHSSVDPRLIFTTLDHTSHLHSHLIVIVFPEIVIGNTQEPLIAQAKISPTLQTCPPSREGAAALKQICHSIAYLFENDGDDD